MEKLRTALAMDQKDISQSLSFLAFKGMSDDLYYNPARKSRRKKIVSDVGQTATVRVNGTQLKLFEL